MNKIQLLTLISIIFSTTSCTVTPPPEHYNIEQEALTTHNKFRALHHAPALAWDNTLATYALHYANKCKFKHSHSPYGENLATGYPSAAVSITKWYDEQADYSYAHPGFSKGTGHFTQLVWKSTTKIGCGYVRCDGRNGTPGKYLVCEYSPAGNVINSGYFARNVLSEHAAS